MLFFLCVENRALGISEILQYTVISCLKFFLIFDFSYTSPLINGRIFTTEVMIMERRIYN